MSPGFSLRPKAEQAEVKRGRPKVQAAEGSLGLGEKRPRSCSSYQKLVDAQRIQELERKVELLALNNAQGSAKDDERIDKVMKLNAQVEDENKKLREQLLKRKSSFDTPQKMKKNRALLRPLTANHPGGRIARVTLRSLVRALRASAASEVGLDKKEVSLEKRR